jgi:hypothetical protein
VKQVNRALRPVVSPLRRRGCAARRTLHTGSDLLTGKQRQRLTALLADDEHVEVEEPAMGCLERAP